MAQEMIEVLFFNHNRQEIDMKTLKIAILLMFLSLNTNVFAHDGDDFEPVGAAERALHKLERLMDFDQVDDSYGARLETVTVTKTTRKEVEVFDITFIQFLESADSETRKAIKIFYTLEKKFQGPFELVELPKDLTTQSFAEVLHGHLSPLKIAELSMHHIEDQKDEGYKPFVHEFARLDILGKDDDSFSATVNLNPKETAREKLIIMFDHEGKIVESKIVLPEKSDVKSEEPAVESEK